MIFVVVVVGYVSEILCKIKKLQTKQFREKRKAKKPYK